MNDDVPQAEAWPALPPVQTGIRGRCPRCGQGKLFAGFLKIADECDVCGLSYGFADPADGPAFFVITFASVPAIVFAVMLQIWADPPMWVHFVISLPLIVATCVLPLRPLKGWLVCSQFFYKAREGRISGTWKPYGEDGPEVSSLPHPW